MAALVFPSHKYPPKIQELKSSIARVENLIEDLEARLEAAKEEHEAMETELFNYHATIAPIRGCPAEVLLMIFEFYLEEDPRLIDQLLLVCREWHHIASTTPQLWNRILVKFDNDDDDDLNIESTSKSIVRHVQMCLQHSGSMLLDLDLDFRGLSSPSDIIRHQIQSRLQDILTFEGQQEVHGWIGTEHSWQDEYLIPECAPYHVYDVVGALLGEDGEESSRWRSLQLWLPEDTDIGKDIWERLSYPTPNLTRMSIRNLIDWHREGWHGKSIIKALPDLPTLKHLEIDTLPDDGCISFVDSYLESLVMYGNAWAKTSLNRFTRLRSLEIVEFEDVSHYYWRPRAPNKFTLLLPELRELTLRGEPIHLSIVEFNFPKLRKLNIIQKSTYHECPLPKVEPLHLRWEFDRDQLLYSNPKPVQANFRSLLVQYQSIKHLTVSVGVDKSLADVLKELKTKGELPPGLATITFEGEEGGPLTINRGKNVENPP